ncbi:Pheromone receptor 1 [Ceratocystis fimbriata CBS 114723]|uniref:Pheromone receptor 1 n=1 Tax=Ceratocystis fimbriata CBS 114723 TaxID=1035309 RepID=A0A2C5X3Y3_9PEZI|nr:Pheromone receptor 1 [Ceratocystis fimbriata CBS 114723]
MPPPNIIDLSYFSIGPGGVMVPISPSTEAYPPGHIANLVCRVVFGIIALLMCLVPLRLLYRNGEFAATVLVISVLITIVFFLADALIWSSLDTSTWWNGVGYCDIHVYLLLCAQTTVVASIFAIMRNLAVNINMMRAGPMTKRERKRKNMIQALIIFPVPLLQLAWIYPISSQRYGIVPLSGCVNRVYSSWPVLFLILPQVIFPCLTAVYAVLIYVRFRDLRSSMGNVLSASSNPLVRSRSNRARQQLYFMSLTIIVPYLPVIMYFVSRNIRVFTPFLAFDFHKIHAGVPGMPWNTVVYIAGEWNTFILTNSTWIYPICAIPIFLFFGLTRDAINNYRRILVRCGMSRFWPWLLEEYTPGRVQQPSWARSILSSRANKKAQTDEHGRHSGLRVNVLIESKKIEKQHARQPSDSSNASDLIGSNADSLSSHLLLPHSGGSLPLPAPAMTTPVSSSRMWDGNGDTYHDSSYEAGSSSPDLDEKLASIQQVHKWAGSGYGENVKIETDIAQSLEVVKKR